MESLPSLESLLVAAVLAVAMVVLAARIRDPARRRAAIVLVVLLSTALAWTASSLRSVPMSEEDVTYRPIAVTDDEYVSSETCQSCHPREYHSWHGSYHRTMTQLGEGESVLGDFDGTVLELHGAIYRLSRGESFFWIEIEKPGVDREPSRIRRPVVMTTGSHHLQAYWYPTGDRRNLAMFPFVYFLADQRWIPREAVFVRPPPAEPEETADETATEERDKLRELFPNDQRWNHTCIHCHSVRAQPMYDELDTRAAEFGIACEACHGPGAEHVRRNQDPLRRYASHLSGEGDDSIVEPRRLAQDRASQVCGICHGVSYPKGPAELEYDLSVGRSYRPGDAMEETRIVVQPSLGEESLRGLPEQDPRVREQSYWADGMIRVKGREYNGLIDSACFERGEMSCFSCHVMHQQEDDPRPLAEWAVDQLDHGMDGDQACLQCHEAYTDSDKLTAHTRHQAGSSGSACYNCHMPFTTYGLLKGIRSHQIDSPSVEASITTGRPNACNQCHLDRTMGWAAGYLEQWYGVPKPEMNDVERSVPASLIWLLTGDAAQRALAAWTLGWQSARDVSDTFWMTPFLAQLLVDPYDAVRYNAEHSLRLQAGFEDLDYDFIAPEPIRANGLRQARAIWRDLPVPEGKAADAWTLVDDPEGRLPKDVFVRLLALRNDRPVALAE